MSFRKRTLAKPNIGPNRRKTQETDNAEGKDGPPIPPVAETQPKKETNTSSPAIGTKLSKRSKIIPNVKARTSILDKKSVQESEKTVEQKSVETNNNIQITNTNKDGSEAAVNNESKNETVSIDSNNVQDETVSSQENVQTDVEKSGDTAETLKTPSNKLQKRKRVMPKLGISKREPKKTEKTITAELESRDMSSVIEKDVNENQESPKDAAKDVVDFGQTGTTIDNKIENSLGESKEINSKDFNVHEAESVVNVKSSSFRDSESRRGSKQVHFESESESETCNTRTSFENASGSKTSSSSLGSFAGESTTKQTRKSNLKKETAADYSSQSEGELSHGAVSLKPKKVFKPNLGARRRGRLSSFSAYSSCDEDDDIDARKEKKAKSEEEKEETSSRKASAPQGKKRKEPQSKEKENVAESVKEEIVKVKRQRKMNRVCTEEKELSTLTMQELIHYRPKSFQKVELRSKKNADNDLEEVAVLPPITLQDSIVQKKEPHDLIGAEDELDDVMAPQLMIDENGKIVINERSLTINKKIDDSVLKNSSVIFEDSLTNSNHRRKAARVKRWKMEETLRFYKALSQIGTDFTLMSQAFGKFTRNELKKKFKQEEKVNCDLVDLALSNRLPLNMEMFLRGKAEMKDLLEAEAKNLNGEEDNESIVGNSEKDNTESIDHQNSPSSIAGKDIVVEDTNLSNEPLQENPETETAPSNGESSFLTSENLSPFKKKRRRVIDDNDDE